MGFSIYPEAARPCAHYPVHHAHGTTLCGHFLEIVSVQAAQCPGGLGRGSGGARCPLLGTHRISAACTLHVVREDAAEFGGGFLKETAFNTFLA